MMLLQHHHLQVGAIWMDAAEIAQVYLRGSEPLYWSTYLAKAGQVYSMDVLRNIAG